MIAYVLHLEIFWWEIINFGIWSCILYLRACIENSRMGIYELKDERIVKQVLMIVMLLLRKGKIRSMFWELSIRESFDFCFLSRLANANFEDKIFIKRVECNTRTFDLRGELVMSSINAKISSLTRNLLNFSYCWFLNYEI